MQHVGEVLQCKIILQALEVTYSNLLNLNFHLRFCKMNVTKIMPVSFRKLDLHSLNKGNRAQYSIVKNVIQINLNSNLIAVLNIATVQSFLCS